VVTVADLETRLSPWPEGSVYQDRQGQPERDQGWGRWGWIDADEMKADYERYLLAELAKIEETLAHKDDWHVRRWRGNTEVTTKPKERTRPTTLKPAYRRVTNIEPGDEVQLTQGSDWVKLTNVLDLLGPVPMTVLYWGDGQSGTKPNEPGEVEAGARGGWRTYGRHTSVRSRRRAGV
jgi:hypothetical protein